MSTMITFVQANGWMILAGSFGLGMLVILVVQLCLLRRVGKMQRKINAITEKVGRYLAVIMEPDPQVQGQDAGVNASIRGSQERMRQEEEQNRIISSMLQEIFP